MFSPNMLRPSTLDRRLNTVQRQQVGDISVNIMQQVAGNKPIRSFAKGDWYLFCFEEQYRKGADNQEEVRYMKPLS